MEKNDQGGIADALREIQQTQAHLLTAVQSLTDRVGSIETGAGSPTTAVPPLALGGALDGHRGKDVIASKIEGVAQSKSSVGSEAVPASPSQRPSGFTSRIVLT